MSVKPIPNGYSNVTPYLIVSNGAGAIEFYKRYFGAIEVMRLPGPGGRVGHAELRIGNSHSLIDCSWVSMRSCYFQLPLRGFYAAGTHLQA